MAKGQYKVVGKGKSGAPITTTSTASTKTKIESTKIFETPKTERMETEQRFAPRLPPCAKQPMSQVEGDLVLSTEASETETENYADSDVEPCTPERKIVLVQPTEPVALADTAMI